MSKPNYRVHLTFDSERKLFLARCPELEHCTSEGATRAEAIQKLEEEIDAQLANMLSHGVQPPRSVDEEDFSGQVTAKVSKTLHRDLTYQARNEGLELELLVGELLAQAMEGRRSSQRTRSGNRPQQHHDHDNIGNRHDGGGNRPRGFQRGGNPQMLDDRATFIEYVRGLEQGGGHAGGHRQGHGGHGGGGGGPGGQRRRGRGGRGGGGGNPNFRNDRPPQQGMQNGQRNGAPQSNGQGTPPAGPPPDGNSQGGGGFSEES